MVDDDVGCDFGVGFEKGRQARACVLEEVDFVSQVLRTAGVEGLGGKNSVPENGWNLTQNADKTQLKDAQDFCFCTACLPAS